MVLTDSQQHAHRIFDVVQRGVRDLASDAVAHSWARCVNLHKLDPSQNRHPAVLTRAELQARQARMAAVIDCARYEMTTLFQQLGDSSELAVVLTDTNGVILHMVSSPDFERVVQPLGPRGRRGLERGRGRHQRHGHLPRGGRPDRGAPRRALLLAVHLAHLLGGADLRPVRRHHRGARRQQPLAHAAGAPAGAAGHDRAHDREPPDRPAIPRRAPDPLPQPPEFVYTLHEGKLVVDEEGRVLAANRSALLQLGLASVGEVRARRLDQIFHTTLDDMLERSHRASFHPGRHCTVPTPRSVSSRSRASRRTTRPPAWCARARRCRSAIRWRGATVRRPPVRLHAPQPTFADPRLAAHLATASRVIARGHAAAAARRTGAGKEVFARAVHGASPHSDGPFIAINCASLPESLIEAELFGYRAGAFTGADKRGRRGKIAQSDGGTLFLDEIGDMPLTLQSRLLRVLDERMVAPLGVDTMQPVDFQLVSASHCTWSTWSSEGRFREDLYYRLAGIELVLPALRERQDRAELIRSVLADEGPARCGAEPGGLGLC
jgi:transcriptional regulator of acetoin/glycerol metabolism